MITKKEFCRIIIDDYKESYVTKHHIKHIDDITDDDLARIIADDDLTRTEVVMSSSSLGVCLVHLGIINPENDPVLYNYIHDHDRIQFARILKDDETDKLYAASLSTRELIDLLPEEREIGKDEWLE